MKHLDTAFRQLQFAWKLYNYALDGHLDLEKLDIPLTFQDDTTIFVLQDRLLESPDDLILACENNLTIAFGAAAITLNRCREDAGIALADPISTEIDQFSAVVYQIRNAFAHDIAEPRWNISNARYARAYEFGGIRVELSAVGNKPFEYRDIGGPGALVQMKRYGEQAVWRSVGPECPL
jgi:hypothetical protein